MNKRRTERIKRRKELEAWSKAVRERDKACQICGSIKFLHAHHILPKEIKETCLEPLNGLTLCSGCHKYYIKSAHKNALWFITWLERHKEDQYNFLMITDFMIPKLEHKA